VKTVWERRSRALLLSKSTGDTMAK